jgi:hypothetical protein
MSGLNVFHHQVVQKSKRSNISVSTSAYYQYVSVMTIISVEDMQQWLSHFQSPNPF